MRLFAGFLQAFRNYVAAFCRRFTSFLQAFCSCVAYFCRHFAARMRIFTGCFAHTKRLFAGFLQLVRKLFAGILCLDARHFGVLLACFCNVFSFRMRSIVPPLSPKERNCYVTIPHKLAATQLNSLYSRILCTRQALTNNFKKSTVYQHICCITAKCAPCGTPRAPHRTRHRTRHNSTSSGAPHAPHRARHHAPHRTRHRTRHRSTRRNTFHATVHTAVHRASYGIFLHVYSIKQRVCIRSVPNATQHNQRIRPASSKRLAIRRWRLDQRRHTASIYVGRAINGVWQ